MSPNESQPERAMKDADANQVKTEAAESSATCVVPPQGANSGVHKWIDTVNKLFQIVALIIAGAWAWIGFKQTIAPGLEPKLGISSDLHWATVSQATPTKTGDKICEASLQVKVNNPSKMPFDVTKTTVTGWIVPLDENGLHPTDAAEPKVLDPERVTSLKFFYEGDGPPVSADLSDHYSEGVENTASFDLFFKYSPLTIVVFNVDVEAQRPSSYWPFFSTRVPIKNHTYQIDQVCGASWDTRPEVNPYSPTKGQVKP